MWIFVFIFGTAIFIVGYCVFLVSHMKAKDCKYKEELKQKYDKYNKIRIIAAIITLIGLIISFAGFASKETLGSSSTSGDTAYCGICEKRYSDRDNVKSINHTNMCKRCYKNYNYAADAAGY